jgi:hypothetical protein
MLPDDGHNLGPVAHPRTAERRVDQWIEELEKLADQFWPGKETAATLLRTTIVWNQINESVDWDFIQEMEPNHEPIPTTEDDVEDICTANLEPHLGPGPHGLGDSLRAELRRQGTDLETLFLCQKKDKEEIPWDEIYRASRKTSTEKLELKYLMRRNSTFNHP